VFRTTDLFLFAAAALVYAAVAAILLAAQAHRGNKPNCRREALKLALFIYIFALLRFTEFSRFNFMASDTVQEGALNLVPFRIISNEIAGLLSHASHLRTIDLNLFGNVLLFMPLGLLVPLIWRRRVKILLIGCAASVCIEVMQFVLTHLGFVNRMADIDDVILNTLGAVAGYWIYALAKKHGADTAAHSVNR
jgi:glycopeptide antibiotics resistance protein